MLKTIGRTLKDINNFVVLLFLFIFVFALLGMEMFAFTAKFNSDGELDLVNGIEPVNNFDNFLNAIISVFIILTNDSWSETYFNYYRATNPYTSTLYFLVLIVIG